MAQSSELKVEAHTIGVAMFGLGKVGILHLQNLLSHSDVRVIYCVDADTRRAKLVEEKYKLTNKVKFVTPGEEDVVLKDKEVAAIVIATPIHTHEKLVLNALEAKKAVFCEKPLAYTYEGMRNCYSVARKSNLTLFCAFNRRFDPALKQIKDRVTKGEIGDVQMVKTSGRDGHSIENLGYLLTSGGIFNDAAVHDIDLICWILGEFPVSIYADGHAYNSDIANIGDLDNIVILLKFQSGVIATLDVSRNSAYGYDQRLEIFGSKGMLCSNNVRPVQVEHYSSNATSQNAITSTFAYRFADSYRAEMNHFINCVKGIEQNEVKHFQTLAVKKVINYCEESVKERKAINLSKSVYDDEFFN
ncbi:inositol 2-dehydrogenase-like protein [Dinothrombium tinctorium]|uniref:Inositol 2-dehydrogenase-like protein n=1 Tax=Dinothrombium tinctorium TaxID=1965070 RepID=A0A3S3PGM0_9ACAR|nr:inositol 2-dehydrogenase-like protein [Dinothrombium tinctorium]